MRAFRRARDRYAITCLTLGHVTIYYGIGNTTVDMPVLNAVSVHVMHISLMLTMFLNKTSTGHSGILNACFGIFLTDPAVTGL